jgi:hypothetical protein
LSKKILKSLSLAFFHPKIYDTLDFIYCIAAVGHLFGPDCTGTAQKEATEGQELF